MEGYTADFPGGFLELEPANSKQFKKNDTNEIVHYPSYDRVVFNYHKREVVMDVDTFKVLAEVLLKNKDVQKHLDIKGGLF